MAFYLRNVLGVCGAPAASTSSSRASTSNHTSPALAAPVKVRRHCLTGGRLEVSASTNNRNLVARAIAPPPRRQAEAYRSSFIHGYSAASVDPYLDFPTPVELPASPRTVESDTELRDTDSLIARLEAKLWDAESELEETWGEMCDVWVGNALVDALVELTPQDVDLDTCDELSWDQLEREMSGMHAMVDVTARISDKTYNRIESKLTMELDEIMADLDELTKQPAVEDRLYLASPAADIIPFDSIMRSRSNSSSGSAELFIN